MELLTAERNTQASAQRWTVAQLGLVVVLVGALYSFILPDLAAEWWQVDESSYGMIIPPLALYIAYLRRKETLSIPAQEDPRGLWLIAAGCGLFILGGLAAEFFLSRVSFVVLLAGLTWTFWGPRRLQSLAFPFVLLATMVPPPAVIYNTLAAPLQLFSSSIATSVAQSVGISVFRDGNIIHLAGISLGVAEACSGLQSLSALMVGALLLGFLESASVLGRVLLFALAAPLAVFVNVVRVSGTAILADYRQDLAEGFYHMFTGWLVFMLGFGLLWITGKVIFRWTRRAA